MAYQNLLFEIEDSIAVITINRPEKLNALNTATFLELNDVLLKIQQNGSIRGVLIKGSGDKAFVAGADIEEIQDLSLEKGVEFSKLGQGVFSLIENLGKPVIALIDGYALGGGCELTMACHLRFASDRSKFGQPEVNLGLIPGYGGTQRLPRLIGRSLALEYLLTADIVSAQRAYEIGLVNKVVPSEELLDTGKKTLKQILSKGPVAVKYILETVHRGLNCTLEEGLTIEADHFGMACATEDMKEGARAFLEKRKPDFKGL
jgi:enoyl-CoA hydratase